MLENIKKGVVVILTLSLIIFTLLAILSIWDVLADDIMYKSLSTLGVLVFSSSVALIIIKILNEKSH